MEEQYYELKEIHEINKIILRELERVCEKNHIRYFLDSGALLGAVRSKSFIPWDDDVDIAFMREDYEKLLSLDESEWGEDFRLYNYRNNRDFIFDYIPRLLYLGCKIVNKKQDKIGVQSDISDRIGIDLFVLDNAPKTAFKHKLLFMRMMFVYGMGLGHRGSIDYSEYSSMQKIVIFLLAHIGKLFSARTIVKWYDRLSTSQNKKNTGYYFYSNYPVGEMGYRFKKEWYKEIDYVQIDDEKFVAPKNWHEVMTTLYGDYMKLPPVEQRVAAHYEIIK